MGNRDSEAGLSAPDGPRERLIVRPEEDARVSMHEADLRARAQAGVSVPPPVQDTAGSLLRPGGRGRGARLFVALPELLAVRLHPPVIVGVALIRIAVRRHLLVAAERAPVAVAVQPVPGPQVLQPDGRPVSDPRAALALLHVLRRIDLSPHDLMTIRNVQARDGGSTERDDAHKKINICEKRIQDEIGDIKGRQKC